MYIQEISQKEKYPLQKHIKLSENKKIIELLKTKSSTKQEVYRITQSVFKDLNKVLKKKVEQMSSQMQNHDNSVEIEFNPKGDFETQIKFSGDVLIFHMHSNIFDFPPSHEIHKTSYVKEDKYRSFCGVIHIYNFLSDSLKYNRLNDVGHLIGRIFVNKESHYFVEGEKQLGFLYNDFVNQTINSEKLDEIIGSSILFTLNFDLHTPKFNDVSLVNVHQILEMNSNQKLQTSKSLGFKFSYENK